MARAVVEELRVIPCEYLEMAVREDWRHDIDLRNGILLRTFRETESEAGCRATVVFEGEKWALVFPLTLVRCERRVGRRRWMLCCPRCGERVATLYVEEPRRFVGCRACVGARYQSQSTWWNSLDSLLARRARLLDRLCRTKSPAKTARITDSIARVEACLLERALALLKKKIDLIEDAIASAEQAPERAGNAELSADADVATGGFKNHETESELLRDPELHAAEAVLRRGATVR